MANIRPLPPLLQKKAIEELNEVPARIKEDIDALRDWITKQPHLRARTSDQFLVAFLRGCKYSLEKAKQKIDRFYTLRAALPEIFRGLNTNDPKLRELIRMGISVRVPVPLHGEDGPRISITRCGVHDCDKYALSQVLQVSSMIIAIQMLEDDNAVISGVVEIMDMELVTKSHLFQINPLQLRKLSIFMEEAMPIRQKGILFINPPPGFMPVFNAVNALMSDKVKARIKIHGNNMEELYKHIPRKYLPAEYGGEAGSFDDMADYWENKIISYHKYFLEDDAYGSDESRRVGGKFSLESCFGAEGSFRKLEVD